MSTRLDDPEEFTYNYSVWRKHAEHDLRHLGKLCEYICRSHHLSNKVLASHVGRSLSTISRFHSGELVLADDVFERYLEALAAYSSPPLTKDHIDILTRLYGTYGRTGRPHDEMASRRERGDVIRQRQCDLAQLSFETITPESLERYPIEPLERMVAQLSTELRPAMITDGLGFVHAVNQMQL